MDITPSQSHVTFERAHDSDRKIDVVVKTYFERVWVQDTYERLPDRRAGELISRIYLVDKPPPK